MFRSLASMSVMLGSVLLALPASAKPARCFTTDDG